MELIWLLIKMVFWLVVIGSFLHVFLSHFLFWVDLRLSQLDNRKPLPSLWVLFRSFALEFAYTFLHALLYPLGFLKTKDKLATQSGTPILFIHGYGHNQLSWFWFMQQFKKQGLPNPLFSINLLPPFSSITRFAEQVQKKVQDIKTQTGSNEIILVGHSMGGLIAAYYAENLALPNEVVKVITLGSPFEGTKTAVLGIGENAEEMQPSSPFLKVLTGKIHRSKVPYHIIASEIDNLIIPWTSAQLPDSPHPHLVIDTDGHLGLLIAPVVINQVLNWVKST